MEKVLITTSSFDLGIPEIKAIRDAGYEIVLNPHGRKLTELEVAHRNAEHVRCLSLW